MDDLLTAVLINEVLNGSSDDKEIATAIVVNEILSGN